MYKVYLRNERQQVSHQLSTNDQNEARQHFAKLVNMTELDGKKMGVAFTKNNKSLAFHRFDRQPGQVGYWRDKLDELNIPGPVGRPSNGTVKKLITITPEMWERAIEIGNGNASGGISEAIAAFEKQI